MGLLTRFAGNRFSGLLLLILTFVSVLVVTGVTLNLLEQRAQYRHQARVTADNLAQSLDKELSTLFEKIDLALADIAYEAARQHEDGLLDETAMNGYIEWQYARQTDLSSVHVSDDHGRLRYGTPPLSPWPSVKEKDFYQWLQSHEEGGLFIGVPQKSDADAHWYLAMARRINRRHGEFAGVVTAQITLDQLKEKFTSLNVGEHGVIQLLAADFKLLARYSLDGMDVDLTGKEAFTAEVRKSLAWGQDADFFQEASPLDGVIRSVAYRRLSNHPFFVSVGLAEDDYLAHWRHDVVWHGLLTGLFILMMVGVGWVLRRAWQSVVRQERKFRMLLESSPYPMVVVNRQGQMVYANPQTADLTGYKVQELLGQPVEMLIPQHVRQDHVALRGAYAKAPRVRELSKKQNLSLLHRTGREIPMIISLSPMDDEEGPLIAAALIDISERVAAEEKIEYLAFRDPLTGLANRRLLQERLSHALITSTRSGRHGAVFLLDLDHFKLINDTMGHDKGDLFLRQVAQRLEGCVREGDTVARLGGDEFVVLCEGLSESLEGAVNDAEGLGEKLLDHLRQAYQLGGTPVSSSGSIGVTLFRGGETAGEELMKQADLAMYEAKSAGRNTLHFFDSTLQEAVNKRLNLEEGIRRALRQGQFVLHYQPQVDNAGRLQGAETLARWEHPQRGLVSPAEFIPVAEESGLILSLGEWVLEEACATLARWREMPEMAGLTLSVNVSAKQLHQPNFVEQVVAILERTQAPSHLLKLELTEGLLVSDVENTIRKMGALKQQGVGFSLDDFGTGYSSLSYLKRLPLDQLKIDQSFVRDLLVDSNDAAIAKMVIALADSLGLPAIAEGVERTEQKDFLAQCGCSGYQGYLFGRPQPLAEFEALARRT